MFRHGVRRFTITAYRAAEYASNIDMANQYGVQLAKAQGHVNGFVGGNATVAHESTVNLLSRLQQSATPH